MKPDQDFNLPEYTSPAWRVGIVYSTYYEELTKSLVQGAKEVLRSTEIVDANITEYPVLGSFEIPLIGAVLAHDKRVDALIGFGIIVDGETRHGEHIASAVVDGMMDVQVQERVPFAYEVLHVHTLAQAQERCSGNMNKGKEAAAAVIHSLAQLKGIQS